MTARLDNHSQVPTFREQDTIYDIFFFGCIDCIHWRVPELALGS